MINGESLNALKLIAMMLLLEMGMGYAVTLPSGISEYIPITLTNNQNIATPANFQQLVTVNSLKYQTYEAANLMNEEFFYINGTIAASWCETNCTSPSTVTNFWLKLWQNGFVPASGTNTIYLGWQIPANDVRSYPNVGQASQFVQNSLDNGNVIFPFYQNFAQNTIQGALPPKWLSTGGAILFTASNIIYFTSGGTNSLWLSAANGLPYSANTPGNILELSANVINSVEKDFALVDAVSAGGIPAVGDKWDIRFQSGIPIGFFPGCAGCGNTLTPNAISGNPKVFSFEWMTPTSGNVLVNYNALTAIGTGSNNPLSILSLHNPNILVFETSASTSATGFVIYDLRSRLNPPGNVMPSATFGSPLPVFTLSIANNPQPFGYVDKILVNQSIPNGDTIALLVNGIVIASVVGNIAMSFAGNYIPAAIGNYLIGANDLTNGQNTSIVLAVQANTQSPLSFNAPLYVSGNTVYLGWVPQFLTLNALGYLTTIGDEIPMDLIYAVMALGFLGMFIGGVRSPIFKVLGKYGFFIFGMLALVQGAIDGGLINTSLFGVVLYMMVAFIFFNLVIDAFFLITVVMPASKGKKWSEILFG